MSLKIDFARTPQPGGTKSSQAELYIAEILGREDFGARS